MNILLLEDEPLVAESLKRLVQQLEPAATISGPIATVEEAQGVLETASFDLIISDIQLADGISIDLFTRSKINCPIIFTTAYNEYAIRAFKLNSIDYLLKPVDRMEMKQALEKFHLLQSKFSNESYLHQIVELFSNFQDSKTYKERFAVHLGRNVVLIPVGEVAAFVKEEIIFLQNSAGKKYITDYRSLDEVEELIDPKIFFRANRQCIVQLSYIDSMRTDETGKLVVKLKCPFAADVLISKEKAATFRKWIEA